MSDGPDREPRRRGRPRHPANIFPTFDEIAARAYELFLLEDRRVDRVFECWDRAETELLDIAARRVTR